MRTQRATIEMVEWEVIVAKMACLTQDQLLSEWPLAANEIAAPTEFAWYADLPLCETFRRFYALSDGGFFGNGMYRILPSREVGAATDKWREELQEDGPQGVLIAGRHVVFGEDSAGAPLIWDSHTDQVSTYWFKGGGWEPVAASPQVFLQDLFDPDGNTEANSEWALAIQQIQNIPLA